MGAWGTAIFSDDLAADIRSEYNALLSIGKNDEQIEELLCGYYASILNCGDPDEAVFWFAFALCEWKKGRLSDKVKSKALSFLDQGIDLERWRMTSDEKSYIKRKKVLEELRKTLTLPMPPQKKTKKPTVHHCPWEVGSLLAYRIATNKEYLIGNPCFMKYALLRVIEIKKYPISQIVPEEVYDERMIVGLYGWIGNEIPDPEIAEKLDFISIKEYSALQVKEDMIEDILKNVSDKEQGKVIKILQEQMQIQTETCIDLDWRSPKEGLENIQYLGCDKMYKDKDSGYFDTSVTSYSMTNYWGFDVTLANRLNSYLN